MASYEQSPQDEGYSEDPLTIGTLPLSANLPAWLASLPVSHRTEYIMSIIDGLPTSEVCEIVRRLRPRLCIDFFQYLPPEVCLKILGFLDPVSLMNTARASREWMLLAFDRKLWEHLYNLEGFRVIKSEIRRFEDKLNSDTSMSRGRLDKDQVQVARAFKKKAASLKLSPNHIADGDSEMTDVDTSMQPFQTNESLFGPFVGEQRQRDLTSREFKVETDDNMAHQQNFAKLRHSKATHYPAPLASTQLPFQDRTSKRLSTFSTFPRNQATLSNISSLVVLDRSDHKQKLNWPYLYSQRRRLEANWEAEKYVNFQLPHPHHPEEAHEECIYTIQHSGKYLVSGSRDKTLRIWDLDSQRLVRPPLRAHVGSVLCLQFDADPEEDLIVSGSSDSTVVLWKFSTGQIIQRLRKAHRESVLNVRFDKRVLVTCSKDKTIKIFNRRTLNPGELGYPDMSQAVNPVPTYLNNYGFNPAPTAGLAVRPPYSLIGCLEGHGAAVNAVQIHGNEVVSASGDRTVKVWNWPEQTCTRTLLGHTKGIACVQYDGRRIVSGSSDNEVKVFDKESGLEVASLRAHTNLVRTVQAGFGDLPYSAEEDKEDAKIVDHEYFKAVDTGAISRTVLLQRGRPRNAGSRKPEDITAYGAKLPPGGGGGRFGRIVSGSYDETIIIWRRDKEGVWKAQHTLRQEEAAHAAARSILARRRGNHAVTNLEQSAIISHQLSQPPGTASMVTTPAVPIQGSTPVSHLDVNAPHTPFAPGSPAFYNHLVDITIPQGPLALRQALAVHPQVLQYSHLRTVVESLPLATQQVMNSIVTAALTSQQMLHGGTVAADGSNSIAATAPTAAVSQTTQASLTGAHLAIIQESILQPSTIQGPLVQAPTAQSLSLNAQIASIASGPQNVTHPPPPQNPPPHHNLHPASMARVFKLQFDARRIICCSQTAVIVGWDFANEDEQIIEASRFFAPIE